MNVTRCATSFTNEFNDQVQGENLYTQIDFSDTEWRYYFSSKLLPTLGHGIYTYDNGHKIFLTKQFIQLEKELEMKTDPKLTNQT